jgi:hypothetical protein
MRLLIHIDNYYVYKHKTISVTSKMSENYLQTGNWHNQCMQQTRLAAIATRWREIQFSERQQYFNFRRAFFDTMDNNKLSDHGLLLESLEMWTYFLLFLFNEYFFVWIVIKSQVIIKPRSLLFRDLYWKLKLQVMRDPRLLPGMHPNTGIKA